MKKVLLESFIPETGDDCYNLNSGETGKIVEITDYPDCILIEWEYSQQETHVIGDTVVWNNEDYTWDVAV